ncbi:MAG TPA: dephospho-CoA kinase [Flavobacterium sp.]|jgi:dephospho-CoA kinase
MTKIIGLTGGIGSGKTTVAKMFMALGVPVYFADDAAKEIMATTEVHEKLRSVFGDAIIENGVLNRKELAKIVFNNTEQLQKLNIIVHPLVQLHFENWLKKHKQSPFIIKEAAILFESGSYRNCDAIITVTAPLEERIRRVSQRDAADKEAVLQRINNQWTDEEKIIKSDYVIQNINLSDTQKQVANIFKIL